MNSTFAIFLDLLVAALLIATIAYSVSLNRSLSRLRDGKAELAVLLQNLSESVTHADMAIKGMKTIANEYDTSLSHQIGAARALVDELQVINETANNLATRIERAVQNGRTIAAPVSAPRSAPQLKAPEPVIPAEPADPFAAMLGDLEETPAAGKGRKSVPSQPRARGGADRELIEAIELLRRSA